MIGPPTWPTTPSSAAESVAGADVSVYPNPSLKGHEKHIFKNAMTFPSRGAEPVIINLTLPPNKSLSLLNTTLS